MHIAINGQDFCQSGTAGFSSGQHGMSSGIAAMVAAAIAGPLTEAVNGPLTSPTIARIVRSRWRHDQYIPLKCHIGNRDGSAPR